MTRNKYFVSYNWYNTGGSGSGRLELFFNRNIAGAKDVEEIEKIIGEQLFHHAKQNTIVVTGWQRFEPPIRDRKLSRLALAKGLR